jgi:hypothetical protein
VRRFDYIVEAIKRAGARKVLFGSDGPWLHPGLELHKVRLLGLPADQEALILGGNVIRLLREVRTEADPREVRRAARPGQATAYSGAHVVDAGSALPPGTQPEYEL